MTQTPSHVAFARTAAAALALVAGAAGTLAAQGRPLFAFDGRVDREVLLVMRGGSVDTREASRADYGRVRVGTPLPQRDGTVQLRVERGRGAADVVQQPSARNDYTAVIRLRDEQAGADDYRVAAYWQPNDGTYAGNNTDGGQYGRGNGRRGDNARRGGWGRGSWGRGDGNRDGSNRDDSNRDDRRHDDGRYDRGNDGQHGDQNGDWSDEGRTGDGRARGGNSPWDVILGRSRGGSPNGSGMLRWSGRVDDVEEIRLQGRRADSYTVSGAGASGVRSSVSGGLPARDAYVQVRQLDGRGRVRVVQQPSARNGYTAVLRVEDRDGGAGYYNFEATW